MGTIKESPGKELFTKYYGSHFFMEREGEYSLYKTYKITKETESEWIRELQNETLEEVKISESMVNNFISLCNSIQQYESVELLQDVMSITESKIGILDTFSSALMLEVVTSNIEYFRKKEKNISTMILLEKRILESLNLLLHNPITGSLKGLRIITEGKNYEDYIVNRIKDDIKYLQTMK